MVRFDVAYPIAQLDDKLSELMGNQPALFHPLGAHAIWDDRILALRTRVQAQARSGITAPNEIHDVRMLLDEMRLIKDSTELATMRRAASISATAQMRAMRATRPGRMEYEIAARISPQRRARPRLYLHRRRRRQRLRAALHQQQHGAKGRRPAAD
jgi:Xaa-Pro aminopeptidase